MFIFRTDIMCGDVQRVLFRCVCSIANWFWWLFNATINPHSRHIHHTSNIKFYARKQRMTEARESFCGAVDETVINIRRFGASRPAVSWICELKNISERRTSDRCTLPNALRLHVRCYLWVRIYGRQGTRNSVQYQRFGYRERGNETSTDGFYMKYASLIVKTNSAVGSGARVAQKEFFGLIYFTGLWPQTHN